MLEGLLPFFEVQEEKARKKEKKLKDRKEVPLTCGSHELRDGDFIAIGIAGGLKGDVVQFVGPA